MQSPNQKVPSDPPGFSIVHRFDSEFWDVFVLKVGFDYVVRIDEAGYGKQHFSDEVDFSDAGRARELCYLLREARSLKDALRAGCSLDQWLRVRALWGLALPSLN